MTLTGKSTERCEEDDADTGCILDNRIRFTILLLLTLCLSSILSNMLTFNFAFICMISEKPLNYQNMTLEEIKLTGYREELDYSTTQTSILFMAVAVGSLIFVFPMAILLNKFGLRTILGTFGFISAITTLLIPLAANSGFYPMLVARVIQGTAFAACLPVMGAITSNWASLKQTGIFIAVLSLFLQFAPIFTMPVSGALCTSSLGWPAIYYLHGIIGIVFFTVFMLYYRNSPSEHPLVKKEEFNEISFGKQKVSKNVPYLAIYKDPAIWAVLVAAFGNFMGTHLSLLYIPTYINKVLFYPVETTGTTSAISPIIMIFMKLITGQTSDKITFISPKNKLRMYNTLSMGLMGFLFIVLALADPTNNKTLCLILLVASTCMLGFVSGGFYSSAQQVSRQYTHFTNANISFLNCICMLLVPLLNEVVAPKNTPETWAIVLWIHGITLLATNAYFCIFCSSTPASWTQDTTANSSNKVVPEKPPLSDDNQSIYSVD